jgi:hypothetical protein
VIRSKPPSPARAVCASTVKHKIKRQAAVVLMFPRN